MDSNKDNYIKSVFIKNGERLKFKMGQSISDDKYLSGSVYFIEEGSARLFIKKIINLKLFQKSLQVIALEQFLIRSLLVKIFELQQNY